MWKTIWLTWFGIFLLIMDTNAGISRSDNVQAAPVKRQKLTKLMFKQEKGRDISNLETNEPGFNFTKAEMEKLKIWPGGVIPYYIDTLSFDGEFRRKLDSFLNSVSNTAGVLFLKLQRQPQDQTSRWVLFLNRQGVGSWDGYTSRHFTSTGVQRVILGYDSPYNGELFETTLAILGVPPQHIAPNRDEYITVKYEKIMPDKKHFFNVLKNDEWLFYDVEYDYLSAGHYGLHKYSIGGYATIEPKQNIIDGIGDGKGFSFTDIWKIRMMYNYISKSRSKVIKKSDCLKMFKPGPKFNTIDRNEASGLGPRPKPSKYLGKTDDQDVEGSGKPQENDESASDAEKLKGKWRPLGLSRKLRPSRTSRPRPSKPEFSRPSKPTKRTETTTPEQIEDISQGEIPIPDNEHHIDSENLNSDRNN